MAKCDKSDVIGYDPTLIANAWAVSLSKRQQCLCIHEYVGILCVFFL